MTGNSKSEASNVKRWRIGLGPTRRAPWFPHRCLKKKQSISLRDYRKIAHLPPSSPHSERPERRALNARRHHDEFEAGEQGLAPARAMYREAAQKRRRRSRFRVRLRPAQRAARQLKLPLPNFLARHQYRLGSISLLRAGQVLADCWGLLAIPARIPGRPDRVFRLAEGPLPIPREAQNEWVNSPKHFGNESPRKTTRSTTSSSVPATLRTRKSWAQLFQGRQPPPYLNARKHVRASTAYRRPEVES